MATTGELMVEIRYIKEGFDDMKEMLERSLGENKKDHQEIIDRQDITNGNIIRQEDRLSMLEKSRQMSGVWVRWLPHAIIAVLVVYDILIHLI